MVLERRVTLPTLLIGVATSMAPVRGVVRVSCLGCLGNLGGCGQRVSPPTGPGRNELRAEEDDARGVLDELRLVWVVGEDDTCRVLDELRVERVLGDDTRLVLDELRVERVLGDDTRLVLDELRVERVLGDDTRLVLDELRVERVTVGVLLDVRRLDERTLPAFPPRRTLPGRTVALSLSLSECFGDLT